MVGRGLIPTVQDGIQPVQPGAALQGIDRAAVANPQRIQAVQKAQATVDEHKQRGDHHRAPPAGHAIRQDHIARKYQPHHQRAGNDHRPAQRQAENHKRCGQAIHQEGIAQPFARQDAIFGRERRIAQAGDDAQMQRQIAIGALPHVQRAVYLAQAVGILQIPAQQRQRHRHAGHQDQQLPVLVIQRASGGFIARNPHGDGYPSQRNQRQHMPQQRKAHGKGQQRGQPHHQQQAQAQPQPNANLGALRRQQRADNHAARKQINQQIQQRQHSLSPFGSSK